MPTLKFFGFHYLSSYQIFIRSWNGILYEFIPSFSRLVFTLRCTGERKNQIEHNYSRPTKVFTNCHFKI